MENNKDMQLLQDQKIRLDGLSKLVEEFTKMTNKLDGKLETIEEINRVVIDNLKRYGVTIDEIKLKDTLKKDTKPKLTQWEEGKQAISKYFLLDKENRTKVFKDINKNFKSFFSWTKDDYADKKKKNGIQAVKRYFSFKNKKKSETTESDNSSTPTNETQDETPTISLPGIGIIMPFLTGTVLPFLGAIALPLTVTAITGFIIYDANERENESYQKNKKEKQDTKDKSQQIENYAKQNKTISTQSTKIKGINSFDDVEKLANTEINTSQYYENKTNSILRDNATSFQINQRFLETQHNYNNENSKDLSATNYVSSTIEYSGIKDDSLKIIYKKKVEIDNQNIVGFDIETGGRPITLGNSKIVEYKAVESSFTYTEFKQLFNSLIKPKLQWYLSTYDKKQWEADKIIVKQNLIKQLGKNPEENTLLNTLFDIEIKDVESQFSGNTFSVESNADWMKSIEEVDTFSKTNGIINNYTSSIKSENYTELQTSINSGKTRKIKLDDFTSDDITNLVEIVRAYKSWELSVIRVYYTWGLKPQDRLNSLNEAFNLFWKKVTRTFKISKNNEAYTYIYTEKFKPLYDKFKRMDKNTVVSSIFDTFDKVSSRISSWGKNEVKLNGGMGTGTFKALNSRYIPTNNKQDKNSIGNMFKSVSQRLNYDMTYIYDPMNKTYGMNDKVLKNFISLTKDEDTRKILGDKKISINSGLRDHIDQVRLWNENVSNGNFYATFPFISPHSVGVALDINGDTVNKLKSKGLLSKYGFIQDSKENWHIQDASFTYDTIKRDYPKIWELGGYLRRNRIKYFIPTDITSRQGLIDYLNSEYDRILGNKSDVKQSVKTSSTTTTSTENVQQVVVENKVIKVSQVTNEEVSFEYLPLDVTLTD
jgi:hypothetical protein